MSIERPQGYIQERAAEGAKRYAPTRLSDQAAFFLGFVKGHQEQFRLDPEIEGVDDPLEVIKDIWKAVNRDDYGYALEMLDLYVRGVQMEAKQ